MADSGSNFCMTATTDGLTNLRNIPPVTLNLALQDGTTETLPTCTKMGYLPLTRTDGTEHLQPFLVNEAATDTIISPEAILRTSSDFTTWRQTGYKDDRPGHLQFCNNRNQVLLTIPLTKKNGLYYCPLTTFTTGCDAQLNRASISDPSIPAKPRQATRRPVHPASHLESELWAARLGHCGEWQLQNLPRRATGLPAQFHCHPFRFVDFKQQAQIQEQPAGRQARRLPLVGKCFYVDFGFIRASTSDYSKPDPKRDRIVESFDGYNSYLLIVDEAS